MNWDRMEGHLRGCGGLNVGTPGLCRSSRRRFSRHVSGQRNAGTFSPFWSLLRLLRQAWTWDFGQRRTLEVGGRKGSNVRVHKAHKKVIVNGTADLGDNNGWHCESMKSICILPRWKIKSTGLAQLYQHHRPCRTR